jgi:serine protease
MKNKIYITILIFLFSILALNAQSNYYYYYKGQKVYLTLDKTLLNISAGENLQKSSVTPLNFKDFNLEIDNSNSQLQKNAKLEFQSIPSDIEFLQKINSLKQNVNINNVSLYFKRTNAPSIGTSKYFYIKLKNENDFATLQQIAIQKNVQIVKQVPYMPNWYILSLNKTTIGNSIDLTNYFYETGLFADVDPAFMFNFRNSCTNDTNFGSLWGLNNSANPNIDINACQAWTLSQGSGVKVAVLDQGIHTIHNDLAGNISSLSFNSQTGTSPSVYSGASHGTHVAGTIGAIKDNNLQVVGVAPLSKIMPVSHSLNLTPNISAELASGISWAYQNGADVINNSWGDQGGQYYNQLHSTILENAITSAMTIGRNNKGTLIVFAAGNWAVNNPVMDYPATFSDDIITVGAITNVGQRSIFNSSQGSGYGSKLDIVAPGSNILSTLPNNSTGNNSGTSMASPHVTGLVALILSANPCLTSQQVRDIIEQTSQKVGGYSYTITAGRPNGTWNNEMGYGLIDAYAAVQMAQSMGSATLDLYVKDSQADTGTEPNTVTQYMWTSEDIWVRNYADNGLNHQNPDYSANGNPNYVYVRVKNKSCITSTGNEQLKVYWAKAGTSLSWPTNWNGSTFPTGQLLGQHYGTVNIPVLQAGQEVILQFPWVVPNPNDYTSINSEPWHFCLLARVEALNDPMAVAETSDLNSNVRNNNNIAWKNVTVVDVLANNFSGVVSVGNPYNHPHTFFLELVKEDLETGKPIFEEAEVGLKMDQTLYNAWERGGKEAQLLDATLDEKRKVVKGNNVILDNIAFNPNEIGTLNVSFNFLTKELTDKTKFVYHVIQKDAVTGAVIGGETYVINKEPRTIFVADAGGDKEVDKNEPITISASQISEPAIYNWYDSNGNLVFTGKDLTIATQVATKYKLEVIATADGFKDYSEVEVNLKPSVLSTIAPNPATNNVTIGYKLNEVGSAYLMIIGGYGTIGTSNNYILDLNSSETNINISNYPNGFYTVALVCNGQIVDAKTLIKQ